jgi:hypothetical protein
LVGLSAQIFEIRDYRECWVIVSIQKKRVALAIKCIRQVIGDGNEYPFVRAVDRRYGHEVAGGLAVETGAMVMAARL